MLKHILIFLVLFIFAFPSLLGQNPLNAMCVNFKDGKQTYLMFSTFPSIDFDDEGCRIVSGEMVVECSLTEIDNVTLVNYDQTGIEEIDAQKEHDIIVDFRDPNYIIVHGLGARETVCIYGLDGIKYYSSIADESGEVNIPSNNVIGNAVYILKTNRTSLKFYKR